MNRPKYRIWDKEKNQFWVPTYAAYKGELEDISMSPNGSLIMRTIDQSIHESVFPDRFIVVLYSGQRDRTGQEIYEGDLIRSNSMHKNNVFEVIYGRCSFEFIRETGSRYRADQLLWDEIEIVGNIHETGRTRKLDFLYQEHQHLKDDPNLPF